MTLRIGTRRSRLALAQATEVADTLTAHGVAAELVPDNPPPMRAPTG